MVVAVDPKIFTPPTGVQSVEINGSMDAGTYEFRVCSVNLSNATTLSYICSSDWTAVQSITIAANKGIRFTWDDMTLLGGDDADVAGYNVAIRKQGDSAWLHCESWNDITTPMNSFDKTVWNGSGDQDLSNGHMILTQQNNLYAIPCGFDDDIGLIHLNVTGTGDLEDVYQAMVDAGYGKYVYYDGFVFAIHGSFYFEGSTTTAITDTGKEIWFVNGGYCNNNFYAENIFGQKDTNEYPEQGCKFRAPLRYANYALFHLVERDTFYQPTIFKMSPNQYNTAGVSNALYFGPAGQFKPRTGMSDAEIWKFGESGFYPAGASLVFTRLKFYDTGLRLWPTYGGGTWINCEFYFNEDGSGRHITADGSWSGQHIPLRGCKSNGPDGWPNDSGTEDCYFDFFRAFNVAITKSADKTSAGVGNVVLLDKDDNQVLSTTTGTDGTLAGGNEWVKFREFYKATQTKTSLGPFTLQLSGFSGLADDSHYHQPG